jgi:hypothetical protein
MKNANYVPVKNPAASCEASSIPMEGESYSRLLTPKLRGMRKLWDSNTKRPYFLLNFIGAFQIKERRQNGPQSGHVKF